MRAPRARVPSILARGASSGITSVAGMPRNCAAIATACAWFPEECATTPGPSLSSGIESTKFEAPRILNAPPVWRFSHLKNADTPASVSKLREVMTGVRFAMGRIRSAAHRMSANVTLVSCIFVDQVLKRFAFREALEVIEEALDGAMPPAGRVVGTVRRKQHVPEPIEGMTGRQRLGVENVERGAANFSGFEGASER